MSNAGRYRITSMEMWDQDFVDAEVSGYIKFKKDGLGEFQFGYVRCDIDWQNDGDDRVEFSFQGFDEMGPTSGRGWGVVLKGEATLLFDDDEESMLI